MSGFRTARPDRMPKRDGDRGRSRARSSLYWDGRGDVVEVDLLGNFATSGLWANATASFVALNGGDGATMLTHVLTLRSSRTRCQRRAVGISTNKLWESKQQMFVFLITLITLIPKSKPWKNSNRNALYNAVRRRARSYKQKRNDTPHDKDMPEHC